MPGLLSMLKALKSSSSMEKRILLLGLDNAGKTSVLRSLGGEDTKSIMPTQGFNIKSIELSDKTGGHKFKLDMWDIGGQKTIRPYWKNYYDNVDSLIYVVDSSDKARVEESSKELNLLLAEAKLASVPLLVFANKQDLHPNCLSPKELAESFNLSNIRNRKWQIQGCSAKTGAGLQDGVGWLLVKFQDKK